MSRKIVNALKDTIIKNPKLARLSQKAKIKKIGPFQSEIKIGKNKIILDEDAAIGGANAGPNPSSTLLGAIGGCMIATIEAWSQILDVPYDSVEIRIKGDLDLRGMLGIDEKIKPEYQNIDIKVSVKSGADEAKVKELIETAEQYCPVSNSVKNPVTINMTVNCEKIT
ncbi:MAG: OsmC family protein [Candidatus Helarchaeota archaeon]